MTEKLFKSEQRLSRNEISQHLRKIAEGVEKGELKLNSGGESVELNLPETSELEVEVEEERDGDISLELEIEWNKNQKASEDLEVE